jgi:hypothetical protein
MYKNMRINNGLMFALISIGVALSGNVSAEPQSKPPLGENTNVTYSISSENKTVGEVTMPLSSYQFLAQADVPPVPEAGQNPDYVDQTAADSTGSTVIDAVTTVLPIEVDTVENIEDIVESGTYLVKSVHKGMTWKEILELVFGILGLIAGIYYYVRHRNLKKLVSAGQVAAKK